MSSQRQTFLATLGPAGSNHEMVACRYCRARGAPEADILLCGDFTEALEAFAAGNAGYVLICAVHPDCADVVGRGQYELGLDILDMFIAESQPLAILTRTDAPEPGTIALHPATESYTDLSAWDEKIHVSSIVAAAEGLLAGKWPSALTAARFAEEGHLRIDRHIPPPRDAWLVLGHAADGDPLGIRGQTERLSLFSSE